MYSDKNFEILPEFRDEVPRQPWQPERRSSDSFGDWLVREWLYLWDGIE